MYWERFCNLLFKGLIWLKCQKCRKTCWKKWHVASSDLRGDKDRESFGLVVRGDSNQCCRLLYWKPHCRLNISLLYETHKSSCVCLCWLTSGYFQLIFITAWLRINTFAWCQYCRAVYGYWSSMGLLTFCWHLMFNFHINCIYYTQIAVAQCTQYHKYISSPLCLFCRCCCFSPHGSQGHCQRRKSSMQQLTMAMARKQEMWWGSWREMTVTMLSSTSPPRTSCQSKRTALTTMC